MGRVQRRREERGVLWRPKILKIDPAGNPFILGSKVKVASHKHIAGVGFCTLLIFLPTARPTSCVATHLVVTRVCDAGK